MTIIRFTILLLVLPTLTFAADLTGVWNGDDGGTYYLTQRDSRLYWYAERSPTHPAWANVFDGRVRGDSIRGNWIDVPKGRTHGEGRLEMKIEYAGNVLSITRKTGGYVGSKLTRAGYTPMAPKPEVRRPTVTPKPSQPPVASFQPKPMQRMVKEDCVSFNVRNLQRKQINGSWKIVDGNHWLFDFGSNQQEAGKALRIIRHYRMDSSCFVGRPNPSLKYLLSSGKAPAGQVAGEDCLAFNPGSVTVEQHNGRWKIVDGSHWLFDFGGNQNEARQALAVIQQHHFTYSCFVGRPNPSFTYLRR
jgi:hypothetical protein